jgi:hypothetical protein
MFMKTLKSQEVNESEWLLAKMNVRKKKLMAHIQNIREILMAV